MAPPKTSPSLHAVQTDVALLKQVTTAIEHTVIAQNAHTNTELREIKAVLREIHDKQDAYILAQAVKMTEQQGQITANATAIEAVNGRLSRTAGFIVAIFTAVLGGMATWPWIKH
jgi:diphthamide synthase (EF-2-diphthine--ammonia ligase)